MKETLRIVHCFRSPVGGIFRHVRDLAEAQVAAGHAVGIVCDSTTGGAFEEKLFEEMARKLALGVSRTPMQRHIGPGDAAAAWRTYTLIRTMRPDVLHGHGAKGGVYARVFGTMLRARQQTVARLYSPHGGSLHYDERTPTGRFFFAIERQMERITDHLLFVSDYERQAFRRKIGVPAVVNSLVYNGLRETEFTPVEDSPNAADFVYVGMMRDLKGPDIFINALAAAQVLTGRRLSAAMVGAGDDLPRYKVQAASLGLADRIGFLPPTPARQAFELGRVVVVPSRAEAMPYIVLEALAAGKPMIASAVGGIPEIFGEHYAALVPPAPVPFAERMAIALADPEAYRQAMPSEAELKARFGVSTMASQIERIYFTALGRAG